jgi:hypothetical protein
MIALTGTDPAISYQLQLRASELCQLCVAWQSKVSAIPCERPMGPSWGPSEELLHNAAKHKFSASWDMAEQNISSYIGTRGVENDWGSDEEDSSDTEFDGGDLFDTVESFALTDAYRESDNFPAYFSFEALAATGGGFSSQSPRKRHRRSDSTRN